jgi:hypothetical protein
VCEGNGGSLIRTRYKGEGDLKKEKGEEYLKKRGK